MPIKKLLRGCARHSNWIMAAATILYAAIFIALEWWKLSAFRYNALDLAIFNQVFFNTLHGHWFASSIHPPSYFGDHVSPIILLLMPVYALGPSPLALLILQTVFLAASGWIIFCLAKKIVSPAWALVMGLAWLGSPFVQNVNLFEFSLLPLAAFLVLLAFYFYHRGNFVWFAVSGMLALLTREDAALVIFMFGIIAWLDGKKTRWILSPAVLSIWYFAVALKVSSVFAAGAHYKFLIYYSWLGSSLTDMLTTLATKPWLPLAYLLRPNNLIMLAVLLLPLAALPLLKPKYLLLSLPIFLQLALGEAGGSGVVLETQYASLMLPGIFIATIFSLQALRAQKPSPLMAKIRHHQPLPTIIFMAALIYFFLTLGPLASSIGLLYTSGLRPNASDNKAALLTQIPKDVAVAATYDFLPALSNRPQLYSFNYIFLGKQQFLAAPYPLPSDTQYIVIDFNDLITYRLQYGSNQFYEQQYQAALQQWPALLQGYGLVAIDGTLALYQKNAVSQFSLIDFPAQKPANAANQPVAITPQLTYLGLRQSANQLSFGWQADVPQTAPEILQITLTNQTGKQFVVLYPFAYDLLSGLTGRAGQYLTTNYWLFKKSLLPGTYQATAQLYAITDGGVDIDAIRSTVPVVDKKNFVGPELPLGAIAIE